LRGVPDGLQTNAQAATTNGGVLTSLSIVVVVYGVIGAVTIARRAYSAGLT
jgi:hypothetical protein